MRKSQLPKSILLVRLSSPSDIVLASPLAEVLKKNNPNARIVWAAQPESEELLENNPYIDRVFVWDKERWLELWRKKKIAALWHEINNAKQELRRENFETAFDLQGLFKSGFITWLSGAKERVGIGSREGSYWFMHKMVSRNIANRDQIGSEYRYLANQLGYEDGDWQFKTHTPVDIAAKAKTLVQKSLGTNIPYVVICPFANSEQKRWSDDNWQQLVLRIRGRYQLRTIVLGAKHEGTLGQQLARKCGAINLAGQTDTQGCIEIMRGAQLFVGVDNALTHIAQSLSPPSMALFGPTRPYLYSENPRSKVMYLDRFCSPCGRKPSCNGGYQCMKELSIDLVLTEVKRLLQTS